MLSSMATSDAEQCCRDPRVLLGEPLQPLGCPPALGGPVSPRGQHRELVAAEVSTPPVVRLQCCGERVLSRAPEGTPVP